MINFEGDKIENKRVTLRGIVTVTAIVIGIFFFVVLAALAVEDLINNKKTIPQEYYLEEQIVEPSEETTEPVEDKPEPKVSTDNFVRKIIVYKVNDTVGVTNKGEVVFY